MSRLLPDDSPRSIGIALALGAASSSCSYAAVAIARSIFRKGANFTAAMAFEMASTNLVLELSIILIVLMGWQFMAAEAVAAPIMVAILAVLFRLFLRPQLLQAAKLSRLCAVGTAAKRRAALFPDHHRTCRMTGRNSAVSSDSPPKPPSTPWVVTDRK
jgi:uncharacterized protein